VLAGEETPITQVQQRELNKAFPHYTAGSAPICPLTTTAPKAMSLPPITTLMRH